MLEFRKVDSESDWQTAADLKRGRAYRDVMSVTGWSWEEVDQKYQGVWSQTVGDFHRHMLENAVGDGELMAWFLDSKMAGYAALRVSPFCGEDGPTVCSCGDMLLDLSLGSELKRQVVHDLIAYAGDANSISTEVISDPDLLEYFVEAGYRMSKATFRI